MKKLRNEKTFSVQEEQLDEQQKLALAVLIQEIRDSSKLLLDTVDTVYNVVCTSHQLRLLDDFVLGDAVSVRARITKYNGSSLSLKVTVFKQQNEQEHCVAIALFDYDLIAKDAKLAS